MQTMKTTQSKAVHWRTECCSCGRKYENGCGSTECCGSLQRVIAYICTLKKEIKGQYASFDAGEEVWVSGQNNGVCTIERRKWKGSKVTLSNVLFGVPIEYVQPSTIAWSYVEPTASPRTTRELMLTEHGYLLTDNGSVDSAKMLTLVEAQEFYDSAQFKEGPRPE